MIKEPLTFDLRTSHFCSGLHSTTERRYKRCQRVPGRNRSDLHGDLYRRVLDEDCGTWLRGAPERLPQEHVEHPRLHHRHDRVSAAVIVHSVHTRSEWGD